MYSPAKITMTIRDSMTLLVFLNVIRKRTRDIQPRLDASRSAELHVWFMLPQSKATLKKSLLPVKRPADNTCAGWELLLKEAGPNWGPTGAHMECCLGRPSGHNFGQPLDRKQTFFKEWPKQQKHDRISPSRTDLHV